MRPLPGKGAIITAASCRAHESAMRRAFYFMRPLRGKGRFILSTKIRGLKQSLLAAGLVLILLGTAMPSLAADEIPVPRVHNLLAEDAKALVEKAGLKAKLLRDRVTRNVYEYNRVYLQKPLWNKSLPPGGEVVLHVYKYEGSPDQMTTVPIVLEKTLSEARELFARADLGEVVVDYWVDNKEEMDNRVVFQWPLRGHKVLKGTKMELLVSKYNPKLPKKIMIPTVAGKPVDQASKTLTNAGLKVKIHPTKRVTHDKKKDGTVVSQSPPPRKQILTGKEVVLYVYRYQPPPPMVEVPEVTGKPLKQAQAILARAGFKGQPHYYRPRPGGVPSDSVVVSQKPPAGRKAPKGSLVNLTMDYKRPDVLPGLQPERWTYKPGDDIRLAFSIPQKWAAGARVGLFPLIDNASGKENASKGAIGSKPLKGRQQGHLTFKAPDKPGRYEFRMHLGGPENTQAAAVSIRISATGR
jgi:beta-lactam-binding protein with PASTA domain